MKTKKIRILVCDDDKYFRLALKDIISDHGIIEEVDTEESACDLLSRNHYDLALIDMNIDKKRSGIRILKEAKKVGVHSIILSSQKDEDIIEEAYNNGCDHFLAKSHYRNYLEPYIHNFKLNLDNNRFEDFFKKKYITQDSDLISKITELAMINLKNKTILITGETGVGKSLIGELLHQQTYSRTKPFIHINCAEIAENLIESELFGHEKGSFTGATHKKIGKLELANGGTLFLDEIGTMSIPMQQKLLKVLDQASFYPVGSIEKVHSNFTLITATCENLFEKITQEKFRKDLFFRISGLNLDIKPIRERKNDIPLLIKHFISNSHRRFIIKQEAIDKLIIHHWPGNTRELKKKIDFLSTKERGIILADDIEFVQDCTDSSSVLTNGQKDFISQKGLRDFIKTIEQESLKISLLKNNGKVSHSIKDLKISASAFYRIYDNINIRQ